MSKEIEKHNIAYYQDNKPKISDAEYDQLFLILKNLEERFPEFLSPDSPTQNVGAPILNFLKEHKHKIPMMSLANGFNIQDISKFIDRTKKFLRSDFIEIYCEPKIDGMSFSATYLNGNLKTAATRGDGYVGEDITENVKTIKNFPHKISYAPGLLEVRGEIFIEKKDFVAFNKKQSLEGKQTFSNSRNFASGSIRQLNPAVTALRPLKYFAYAIGYSSKKLVPTQEKLLSTLADWGFQTNKIGKLVSSLEGLKIFYQNLFFMRDKLRYEIDGAVYKINDFELQQRLGFITRTPKFAIAHKFPAKIAETKLVNILIQVGRTGILTPIAELEQVKIGGVTIGRATLHNFAEIKRLDIRIGDTLSLYRAGDVIPKIDKVVLSKRTGSEKEFPLPSKCPSCGIRLKIFTDYIIVRCHNKLQCPSQLVQSIIHFTSKNGLNIKGLGKKQIKFLYRKGFIKNLVDIFFLEKKNLESLIKIESMKGWGKKSVEKLFISISNAKHTSLCKFIYSLGINNVGRSNAETLAKEFKNIENFIDAILFFSQGKPEAIFTLASLKGFAKKIITEIKNFFSCKNNIDTVYTLKEILTIQDYKSQISFSPITGLNIVFTGSLTSYSRDEAKFIAKKLGAKTTASISANTDLVVAGEKAGSKLKKANSLGIKVLSEGEWLTQIKRYL